MYAVKTYGWDWTSVEAADAYKLILIESGCFYGSFADSEDLALLVDLADEVVRLEGRIPDSFKVAVDLGSIYSAVAMSNARDVKVSDEFIAKANEAWRIASSHLEKGMPKDAALLEPGPLRAAYVGGYWQIACEIGFARYVQTDCTDVGRLRALKTFWERAKQERPNHPVLRAVGEQIDQKLSPAEQAEQVQERAPAFLPGMARSAAEPPRQASRALMAGSVVAVAIALTGLAYVYRTTDSPQKPQEPVPAGPVPSPSERATFSSETTVAAPSNQQQAIGPGELGDKEPKTVNPRAGELPGNGVNRAAIVAMKAKRPLRPTRKTQRSATRAGPALSKQASDEMQSDIYPSEAALEDSQPVASSEISPSKATSPPQRDECAQGFAGIICREVKRWERCGGRWGTPGCEVYENETVGD